MPGWGEDGGGEEGHGEVVGEVFEGARDGAVAAEVRGEDASG